MKLDLSGGLGAARHLTTGLALLLTSQAQAWEVSIVAAGGDACWSGNTWTASATCTSVAAPDIQTRLAGGNVTIDGSGNGSGDLLVEAAITWSSAHQLLLRAERNIEINATIDATGSGTLALHYNQAGGGDYQVNAKVGLASTAGFTTQEGGGPVLTWTVLTQADLASLSSIDTGADDRYVLGGDIDASATAGWDDGDGGDPEGFKPIAYDSSESGGYVGSVGFLGRFDGLGHRIAGLTIARPAAGYIGLFRQLGSGATVRHLTLENASIGGSMRVGALAGQNYGSVSHVRLQNGTVVGGTQEVGGLVGRNQSAGANIADSQVIDTTVKTPLTGGGLTGVNVDGSIADSRVSGGSVSGVTAANGSGLGGLSGTNTGSITGCMADGVTVQGAGSSLGGLVGYNSGGTITGSETNDLVVTSTGAGVGVGGLVGTNIGTIDQSHAFNAEATGYQAVGGLVGRNGLNAEPYHGHISHSSASGKATGTYEGIGDGAVGGLAGWNLWEYCTIANSHADVEVTANASKVGGLVGRNEGSIVDSYAIGAVAAGAYLRGGLVGGNGAVAVVQDSFYATTDAGGTLNNGGDPGDPWQGNGIGTGKTLSELRDLATYTDAGWDIDDTGHTARIWRIYHGFTTPLLRHRLTPVTVTASDDDKTHDGVPYSGGNGVAYSDPAAILAGTLAYDGDSQGAVAAGDYAIVPAGLYSDQKGYDILFAAGTLTIEPEYHAITVNAGSGGTADCDPNPVSHGDSSTCTATADPGYSLTGWSGDCTGMDCILDDVTDVREVTAGFAPITGVSGPSATGSGTVSASVAGGGATCRFLVHQFRAVSGLPTPPAHLSFPHGLFEFTLAGCTPGSTVTLTVTYPGPLPANARYWKFGPTPDNALPHWYVLPATLTGNTATFTITDGGLGDDDLTADGTIVDQGGPGIASGTAVPMLPAWGFALLSGLLGVAGGLSRRYLSRQSPNPCRHAL